MTVDRRAHTRLVRQILAELGAEPDLLLAENPVGQARYVSSTGKEYFVPYGWLGVGAPDLVGVLAPRGSLIAFECKTGDATTSPEQKRCHAALERFGALVFVVRSVEDARRALTSARAQVAA